MENKGTQEGQGHQDTQESHPIQANRRNQSLTLMTYLKEAKENDNGSNQ